VFASLVGLVRRRRFALLRTLTLAAAYAVMELWGLLALGGAWVLSGFGLATKELERRAFWVQRLWLRGLWWATLRCFRLSVELDGEVHPAGPVLVFARHTSMLDVLIPGNYVLSEQRRLRWVLKKELLLEPCLDIAGHWMPNHFVDRSGQDSEAELSAIQTMARGLGEREGAIIFPEGTRFTQGRRARVLERLRDSDPKAADYAEGLQHLLPPRLGGSRSLLEAAPEAKVLFLAHYGLEGSRSWAQLVSGRLVGRTLFVRVYEAERPGDAPGEVQAWLRQHWARMDGWIDAHQE
jgi:1-acyl-sn-glycerol-3-phosphate acyltransferase